jgi:hypothetical protein
MKKKLLLLVGEKCNRNCRLCANKQFNLEELHVETNFAQYSEIILTGGEPMLNPEYLLKVCMYLRDHTGVKTKIYLHTAKVDDIYSFVCLLDLIDGITISLYNEKDVVDLKLLDTSLDFNAMCFQEKSLQLYVFNGVTDYLPLKMHWNIIKREWLTDCPVPDNEVFKRFAFID